MDPRCQVDRQAQSTRRRGSADRDLDGTGHFASYGTGLSQVAGAFVCQALQALPTFETALFSSYNAPVNRLVGCATIPVKLAFSTMKSTSLPFEKLKLACVVLA